MVNVKFFDRSAVHVLMATALVLVSGSATRTLAQERQGCFMVKPGRQVIELNDICPTPIPFLLSGSDAELGTGDIQVTLRWATTDDVDLAVVGPDGARISWENPGPVASGGTLDRDDNSSCAVMTESPIENIYWPTGQAPDGSYSIEVNLFQRCAASSEPISFEVRLLVQGVTETITGTVSEASPSFNYNFSVPLEAP